MRRHDLLVITVHLCASLSIMLRAGPSCAQLPGAPPPRSWFALDLEPSLMLRAADWTPFFHLRGRAGYSYIRSWKFFDVTLTAEHLTVGRTAFGVMGSVTSIEQGWTVQAGATVSLQGHPGFALALGYSLIRVEMQVLVDEPTQFWLGVGVRIPFGAIAHALWGPRIRYQMPATGVGL